MIVLILPCDSSTCINTGTDLFTSENCEINTFRLGNYVPFGSPDNFIWISLYILLGLQCITHLSIGKQSYFDPNLGKIGDFWLASDATSANQQMAIKIVVFNITLHKLAHLFILTGSMNMPNFMAKNKKTGK